MFKRLLTICVLVFVSTSLGAAQGAPPGIGDYIVVLKSGSDSTSVAAKHKQKYGAELSHVYNHALKGYSAKLPEAALARIESSPEVLFVSQDGDVQAQQSELPSQVVSNGVLRIDGDESSTRSGNGRGAVNVNVAVIDDGGPVNHPDLNVLGQTSCLGGNREKIRSRDGTPHGWHGTMVGGFIGALDNAFGRVGVAPGARLWAVRALDDNGFGTDSEIICGLDWVTATRTDANPTNDIAVANLSLAGQVGPPGEACAGAQHAKLVEICGAVQAGITIVAAAGNESQDFQSLWPATYDGVLAVTAMADSDGQAGGRGPTLPSGCSDAEADDTVAFFSNFATLPDDRVHTVAAPGVCIGSTWPDGLYAIHSGTSFATPLVSGTVALCIASGPCAGLTPRQIIQKVVSDAGAYNTSKNGSGHGFQGDPLRPISGRYYGYLINAGIY